MPNPHNSEDPLEELKDIWKEIADGLAAFNETIFPRESISASVRNWLLLVVFLSTIGGAVYYLRHQQHSSWLLIGRLVVDVVIPLAMAWAGVYLAADAKEGVEKKLWQAVFGLLALFGLVVGVLNVSRNEYLFLWSPTLPSKLCRKGIKMPAP